MSINRGTAFLVGAAAAAWMIYDMATASEAPSQTLAALKYLLLAVLIVATLYSGAKWLTNPPPERPKEHSGAKRSASRRSAQKP